MDLNLGVRLKNFSIWSANVLINELTKKENIKLQNEKSDTQLILTTAQSESLFGQKHSSVKSSLAV